MTAFIIHYKTMKQFGLQISKKSYTNGCPELVKFQLQAHSDHIGNV